MEKALIYLSSFFWVVFNSSCFVKQDCSLGYRQELRFSMAALLLNMFKQVAQYCIQCLWPWQGSGGTTGHSLMYGSASIYWKPRHSLCTRCALRQGLTSCLNLAVCALLRREAYHWAGELLTVTHMCLTVQPDLGKLGDVSEAESVELECRPICFPVLVHKNGAVRGTPVLWWREVSEPTWLQWNNSRGHSLTYHICPAVG